MNINILATRSSTKSDFNNMAFFFFLSLQNKHGSTILIFVAFASAENHVLLYLSNRNLLTISLSYIKYFVVLPKV